MSDLIRREDAINALVEKGQSSKRYKLGELWELNCSEITDAISAIPSAEPEPEEFEWCHGCKEYDQEKHCCHRWTKVIRQTVEEVKRQYAFEYPKIIHCEDCKFYTPMNRKLKTGICSLTMHHLGDEGFCSDAEMRGENGKA